jgi:hypothetical protein
MSLSGLLSDTEFFAEDSDAQITTTRDAKGPVAGLTLRLGTCQESRAKKIE